jgi:peptide/nickel transport system permease protein
MIGYIARRLAISVPILIGISLLVFLMLHSAGSDPALLILRSHADPESIARVRHELGLDRPLAVQYLDFIGNAVTGDFGRSYRSNAKVADEVFSRFPATIELAVAAMLIGGTIGFVAGSIAGRKPRSWFDYSSTFTALLGISIPTFWLGLLLIITFGLWLEWLPLSGRVNPRLGVDPSVHFVVFDSLMHGNWTVLEDSLKHLILPALTLAGWPAAIVARMTRASLIEAMGQDYVRTARAKGLSEGAIVRRHAYRNAMVPVLTVVGLEFGSLLGGAVVTETVFAWPGVGKLTVDAIGARDYQVTQGVVLLLGAVFVLLNLIVDIIYAVIDPRIRLSS